MITSLFMKAPTLRTAEILTRRGLPVHLYSFEYVGRSSLWNFIPLAAAIIDFVEIPAFDGGITHAGINSIFKKLMNYDTGDP